MKILYRILILLAIFAGSLYYFGTNMTEKVFHIEKKAMAMEETTLPYITLSVEGQEINLLHGYCSGLDELTVRESLTPLSTEQSFSVIITEKESDVKKLKYEVMNLNDGKTMEEGTVNALDHNKEYKVARITLKEALTKNTEYVLRITLITDKSKRIYYYTRIKVMEKSNLVEKLAFVDEFHQATLSKDTADIIEKYLEKPYVSATNFAKVTIQNDYDTITYRTLEPKQVFLQVPTITEIGTDTASIRLDFMVAVQTSTGLEYYRVCEHFRFMYTSSRCYLYDYDRTMESVFDVGLTSLSKGEFKIGITSHPEMAMMTNSVKTSVAFVRERALWSYSISENTLTEVFSFYQRKTDFIRDTFNQHDIRILNIDDAGNIDFLVYGYMNRGEYEGRVGIILYHYDRMLQRNEEMIYIPINTTYELLKEQMGDFSYKNQYEIFYLHIFDSIYSYNLTTKSLQVIATGVQKDDLIFSRDAQFIAYQERQEKNTVEEIHILDLESGDNVKISGNGEPIRLLGMIDENIIYGIARTQDQVIGMDGTRIYPMQEIFIVNQGGENKKRYKKDGYYVVDAKVSNNVIELKRIRKIEHSILSYEWADSDYILNSAEESKSSLSISKRVTDMMLTEYYLSMGLSSGLTDYPKLEGTKNTIISEDRTVRINSGDTLEHMYLAYAFGNILASTSDIAKAIREADEASGIVLDNTGQIVWERGVKSKKSQIGGITVITKSESTTSLQACIKMLLAYRNCEAVKEYNRGQESVLEYLKKELTATPVKAESIMLDEALYFVYRGKPVISFKESGEAVLITGYDGTSITVIDPTSRSERKISLKEAVTMFEEAGNVFITYVE